MAATAGAHVLACSGSRLKADLQAQEFLETVQDIQEFSDALCFRLKACEEKAKNSRDKNKIYKNAANISNRSCSCYVQPWVQRTVH